MARDTNSWLWRLRVIGTEEVTVPAGTYNTFIIEGIEAAQQSGPDLRPITTLYQWWYAPKINFVVRLMERRITGPMTEEQPRRTELRKIVKLDCSHAARRRRRSGRLAPSPPRCAAPRSISPCVRNG